MRDFFESEDKIQCCHPRCKKIMKKTAHDKRFGEAVSRLGNFAKLCRKHSKALARKIEAEENV